MGSNRRASSSGAARASALSAESSTHSSLLTSLRNFRSQYLALVIKNLRLSVRNWKATLGLVLAPIMVVLFLVVMQQIANLVLKHTDAHPAGRQISPLVPPCVAGPTKHCFSVVYAPANVPWVNNAMHNIAAKSGLEFERYFYGIGAATDIWSWETDNTTMTNFFIANQNVTQVGVIFTGPYVNSNAQGEHISNELGYWLHYNQSLHQAQESTMLAIETEISNQMLKRTNNGATSPAKFAQGDATEALASSRLLSELLQDPLATATSFSSSYSTNVESASNFDISAQNAAHSGLKNAYHTFGDSKASSRASVSKSSSGIADLLTSGQFSFNVVFKEFPVTLLRIAQLSLANQSGGTLYFIPLMIIFFVLLTEVVAEKESKLRVGMKMMGLSNAAYWSSWYTHGIMWIFVVTGIQYLAGLAAGYTFFTKSNAFSVLALFWTFGIAMMTVAFFLSTLIASSKTAQTVGYAIILLGFVFQAVMSSLNGALVDMLWLRGAAAWIVSIRYILSFYPPFSFAKAWSDISSLSSAIPSREAGMIVDGPGFHWSDMYKYRVIIDTKALYVASPPPANAYYTLLLNILGFALLAWYLDNVLPGEHGSPRPFYFPFTREYWGFKKSKRRGKKTADAASSARNINGSSAFDSDVDFSGEAGEYDSDVEQEMRVALSHRSDSEDDFENFGEISQNSEETSPVAGAWSVSSRFAVHLKRISKLYRKWSCCRTETDTYAVNDVSFTIKSGELFTLLGHNGAGKTTLISMLTGLFAPSSGSATIYGLDLEEDAVRSLIGVCPQHDVLWSDLTAREHLLLFARVKGIPSYLIDTEVHEKLQLVGLEKVANEKAGSFSGGMKRRLSVAVSCIGDPKLIFLDEPSSGLDPVNKRKIWRMIEGLKSDRAIVLTTHSMEEAEVLSDRLAIMAFGKIRAIGDSLHLKNKYGDGYRISMVVDVPSRSSPNSSVPTTQYSSAFAASTALYHQIKRRWPDVNFISNDSGMLLLGCPKSFQESIPALLDFIMADTRVKEWGLSHSTLESVFLAVTKKHNFVYEEIEDPEDFVDVTEENSLLSENHQEKAIENGHVDDLRFENGNSTLNGKHDATNTVSEVSSSTGPSDTRIDTSALETNNPKTTDKKKAMKSFPLRALVRKNLTLQWRQRFSTLCQLLTPLLIILILVILKAIMKSQLGDAAAPHIFPGRPVPENVMQNLGWDLEGLQCNMFFAYSDPSHKAGILDSNGNGTGLLGHIPQYSCTATIPSPNPNDTTTITNKVPYWNALTDENTIQAQVYSNFTQLNHIPINKVGKYPYAWQIPDGYAVFNEVDETNLKLSVVLGVNTNPVRAYHRANNFTRLAHAPKGFLKSAGNLLAGDLVFENGFLSLMTMLSRSFTSWALAERGIDTKPISRAFNTIMTQPMPQWSENNVWAFLELAGTLLYPLGLTLQIPLYMYLLTLEKSEKLREMMLSHGLKTRFYHATNYVFFFIIYAFAAALFWLAGIITNSRFFTDTHWSILLLFFVGWGLSLVSLACFVSAFLNSPRVATVAGYIIALFGTMLAFIVCVGIYGFTPISIKGSFPYWTYLWPQFSFSRGMYLLNDACALKGLCYGPVTHLTWSDPFAKSLLALYLAGIVYYVLFLYLDAVLPREYGIPKHPLFFLFWFYNPKRKSTPSNAQVLNRQVSSETPQKPGRKRHTTDENDWPSDVDENEAVVAPLIRQRQVRVEDVNFVDSNEDVSAETARVLNGTYATSSPLVCQGLRKVYDGSGKVAVKGLWLAVSQSECFGLLGENGAGKSTTLSMLTGMFEPSDGTALVGGYDIRTEIDQVHLSMGLCPQFDLLWSDLTVKEHLLFYARLKGIESDEEDAHVDTIIQEVGLSRAANKRADALSGGMRRRLSIAISLVGDSKIVFLDEPTTGLDAASRRQIWAIIRRAKRGRAIILTTHSMDEAELLCNRIGILAHGKLRCIGNQQHLKTLFGEGLRLKLNYGSASSDLDESDAKKDVTNGDAKKQQEMTAVRLEEDKPLSVAIAEARMEVMTFIQLHFPTAAIVGDYHGTVEFLLAKDMPVATIFRIMENQAPKGVISDWAVSQVGLEDVFQTVVAQAEREFDSPDAADTLAADAQNVV